VYVVIAMSILERIKRWVFKGEQIIEIPERAASEISLEEIANNPLFRAALSRIAQSAASVPLKVYDGDKEIEHHITERFADNLSTHQAIQLIVQDLYTFGNSFFMIRRVGKRAVGLTYLPYHSVAVSESQIVVYTETGTQPIAREDLVWFKFVNPADPDGLGVSVAQTLAFHIKLLNEIDRLCFDYIRNGALPMGIIKVSTPIEKNALEREKERFHAAFGRGNRYQWFITTSGVTLETVSSQLRLGDLPEIRRTLREEILSVLNVPPAVLGFYEYANYANAREQTKIFWRETVIPLLVMIAETVNAQYLSKLKSSVWCEFDFTAIPYTKERLDEVASSLRALVDSGILTINEAREVLGFNEPLEWGDTWWGNLNTVPIAERDEGKGD